MSIYIKKFNGHTDYSSFIQTDDFIKPNVSLCVQENDVHYNKKPADKLQSILDLNLTEYAQSGEWHPTNDELAYIQESYDANPCCGAVTFPDTTYYARFYTNEYHASTVSDILSFVIYVDTNGHITDFAVPMN